MIPAFSPQEPAAAPAPAVHAEVVFEAGSKLGGCAAGDLDPSIAGDELAAVSVAGQVFVLRRGAEGWSSELACSMAGELVQCATGDADGAPGAELVAVGMLRGTEDGGGPGAAYLVTRHEGAWRSELLLEDTALLHAGCIADVDPRTSGNEIVLGGFGGWLVVLRREREGWARERVAEVSAGVKCLVPFQGGVAAACTDGKLLHLTRAAGGAAGQGAEEGTDAPHARNGWSLQVLDESPAGLARLGTDGDRLVAARDDGALVLIAPGTARPREELYREQAKLRGAVLAELDPARPGLEVATAGYGRAVTVLHTSAGGWSCARAYEDAERLHHLAVGELDPAHPGLELAACGYSGKVILVRVGG